MTLTPQEGTQIVAEVEAARTTSEVATSDAPGYDALDANGQALFGDQAGFDRAHTNADKIEASYSPEALAAMTADSLKLLDAAQHVVARLLSLAEQGGGDALMDAYDVLSAWLPLSSSAALAAFLVKHDFIKG
ncbi:MAG: hypothetical protein GY877_00535 [Hyphomicrobium sp.]|nr:hypothetical protein [Hyphomicrobium sp.]